MIETCAQNGERDEVRLNFDMDAVGRRGKPKPKWKEVMEREGCRERMIMIEGCGEKENVMKAIP